MIPLQREKKNSSNENIYSEYTKERFLNHK